MARAAGLGERDAFPAFVGDAARNDWPPVRSSAAAQRAAAAAAQAPVVNCRP